MANASDFRELLRVCLKHAVEKIDVGYGTRFGCVPNALSMTTDILLQTNLHTQDGGPTLMTRYSVSDMLLNYGDQFNAVRMTVSEAIFRHLKAIDEHEEDIFYD